MIQKLFNKFNILNALFLFSFLIVEATDLYPWLAPEIVSGSFSGTLAYTCTVSDPMRVLSTNILSTNAIFKSIYDV